jgi:hypothetical protein
LPHQIISEGDMRTIAGMAVVPVNGFIAESAQFPKLTAAEARR